MSEAVQMNLNVKPETRERVKEIARLTYRGMNDVIDWLVEEKLAAIQAEKVRIPLASIAPDGQVVIPDRRRVEA